MKILLATPLFPPEVGGPATYTVEVARRLVGAHEVVIVAYADGAEEVPSAKLVTISKRQALPLRLARYFFKLLLEGQSCDVMYAQNAVAAGFPAALAGIILNKPVILKLVGDEAWERATQAHKTSKILEDFLKAPEGGWRTSLMIMLEGWVLRHVSFVTTPSAYLSELLITYYGVKRERTVVNYNAVDEFPVLEIARKPHQLVTAVRLVSWKGVDGIIRALVLLKEKFADVHLMVAGDGPEKQKLEALALEHHVRDHVTFLGRVSHQKVIEVESESAVQILNSSYEGLPHGALESFATYTPMVATNTSGTNEAVYNEKSGLLVPVGDDKALADAVERMLVDEELRKRVVEGGAEILKEKFSWGTHMRKLMEMFESAK